MALKAALRTHFPLPWDFDKNNLSDQFANNSSSWLNFNFNAGNFYKYEE